MKKNIDLAKANRLLDEKYSDPDRIEIVSDGKCHTLVDLYKSRNPEFTSEIVKPIRIRFARNLNNYGPEYLRGAKRDSTADFEKLNMVRRRYANAVKYLTLVAYCLKKIESTTGPDIKVGELESTYRDFAELAIVHTVSQSETRFYLDHHGHKIPDIPPLKTDDYPEYFEDRLCFSSATPLPRVIEELENLIDQQYETEYDRATREADIINFRIEIINDILREFNRNEYVLEWDDMTSHRRNLLARRKAQIVEILLDPFGNRKGYWQSQSQSDLFRELEILDDEPVNINSYAKYFARNLGDEYPGKDVEGKDKMEGWFELAEKWRAEQMKYVTGDMT